MGYTKKRMSNNRENPPAAPNEAPPHLDDDAAADRLIDASYDALTSDDGFQEIMDKWDPYVDTLNTEERRVGFYGRIAKHISRAHALMTQLAPPHTTNPIVHVIQSSNTPAIALDAQNQIIEANQLAQLQWGASAGETTDFPWLSYTFKDQLLEIRRVAKTDNSSKRHIVNALPADADNDPNTNTVLLEVFEVSDGAQSDCALIIRALTEVWSVETEETLRNSFQLTDGEVSVAKAFLMFGNTDRIAQHRHTSPATIRKQLKAIFAKTGVSNQAQLQKLLALLSFRQRQSPERILSNWQDPLKRERLITDPQGRRIAFSFIGDPKGTPALLSHGTITGYVLHPQSQAILERKGIKLYVPCRAGFGHTDRFDDMSAIEAAIHINRTLMAHLDLNNIPAIGLISGLVPLVKQSALYPGDFSRLLVIGGCVPIYQKERLSELPVNSRALLTLQKNAPKVASLAIEAGFRQVLRHGPSYMVRKIYGNCDEDRETLRDLGTLSLMVASTKMLTVHKTETFERELSLINYDWEADLAKSKIELSVMQGLEDPVFREKHARDMASRYPNYTIIPIQGAGQLVFLQAPEAVGQSIVQFVTSVK